MKLKTRYLLPLSLINFSYCDHRTQQKYTLQSVSFNTVRSAVDYSRPAVYPTGIVDVPSLISGPKKSIPSTPGSMEPIHTPRRPFFESSHNIRPVTYSTILSKATNIESSHSVRPVTHGTRFPNAANFESSYNVRPATYGTYLPKTTDFIRGNLPQEPSFRTPLSADISHQHTRWHYNTDLERQGIHQTTTSSHAVDSTRSWCSSCCTIMFYALVSLSFLSFMAYLGVGAKRS